MKHSLTPEGFLECRLTLPVVSLTDWETTRESLVEHLENLKRKHAIVWIMFKPKSSMAELKSQTFFSTLEYAAVPYVAMDLFVPLIHQLAKEWDNVYKAMEQHSNKRVGTDCTFGDLG